jgi:hypothetical protein
MPGHDPEAVIARIGFLLFRIKKRTGKRWVISTKWPIIKLWPRSGYSLRLRICRPRKSDSETDVKETLFSRISRVLKVIFAHTTEKVLDLLRMASLKDAVLHEKGIIFDPSRMERRVVILPGSYSKNFRLQVSEHMMWFTLDLGPILTNNPLLAQKSDIWLILPRNIDYLNAGGLLGRGLCIIQIGEAENVPVPDCLRPYTSASHWTVTPSMFSAAFTCGVVTDMTESKPAFAPIIDPSSTTSTELPSARDNIVKSLKFCLLADMASWPAVHDVNQERARHPAAYGGLIFFPTFLVLWFSLSSMGSYVHTLSTPGSPKAFALLLLFIGGSCFILGRLHFFWIL